MNAPNRPPEPAAPVIDGDLQGTAAPEADLPVDGTGVVVSLDRFEGPLDLLLHLIREEELDIYDIPIARITDQYLASIENMERLELDLDRAGEFLLMAATLMRIKSKMLLPRDEDEEEEEEVDPRAELVRRLLEYREFKHVADSLRGREDEWRNVFLRAGSYRPEPEDEELTDLGISMVDLFRAFRGMLEKLEDESPFRMASQEYAIEERMDFLREHCTGEEGGAFRRLLGPAPSRALLISTFLAMLELIRLREVVAAQVDRFGEIWIRVRKEEPVAP